VIGSPTKPGKFPASKWTHTVKREGTGVKTRYTILPDEELTDVRKKFLATLQFGGLEEIAEKIEYDADDQGGADAEPVRGATYQQPPAAAVDAAALPF
jgi:hypothetical protein